MGVKGHRDSLEYQARQEPVPLRNIHGFYALQDASYLSDWRDHAYLCGFE
jgi:hypothetical protein